MTRTDFPRPSWKPTQVEDVAEIEARVCEYTNRQRAFVVYNAGTVVFSDSFRSRDDRDYNETLGAVVGQPPDFKVMPMQDGNFVVRFAGPVTGIVLSSFFKTHRDEIVAGVSAGGLLPGEQLLIPSGFERQPEHYFIGLYARAKLYSDVWSLKIARRSSPLG